MHLPHQPVNTGFTRTRLLSAILLGLGGFSGQAVAEGGSGFGTASFGDVDVGVSLILDGVYYHESRVGNEDPAGFDRGHNHDHGHGHDHGFENGFNAGHSELALTAQLGDVLDGFFMLGFDDKDIEVEEAYVLTRSLPAGFQLKAGKFLSDIGYINSRHVHDWDFIERPLVNEYIFGYHGLQELGVQATYVPPTTWYTRLGIEVFQGDDSDFAHFDGMNGHGGHDDHNGHDDNNDHDDHHGHHSQSYGEKTGPKLFTVFAKTGPDLGPDHALQLGTSAGYTRQVAYLDDHGHHAHALEGDAWFAGVDLAYRFDSGQQYGLGNWKLTGEYYYARRNLTEYVEHGGWERRGNHTEKQDGAYIEAVYGFAPRWQAGLRAEALGLTNSVVDFHPTQSTDMNTSYRYSGQVTFRPIEPVFIRAQVTYDDFAADDHHGHHDYGSGSGLGFFLQANVALGAHGAHRF